MYAHVRSYSSDAKSEINENCAFRCAICKMVLLDANILMLHVFSVVGVIITQIGLRQQCTNHGKDSSLHKCTKTYNNWVTS